MVRWEVVGGSDKRGILVREGRELTAKELDARLSKGALVEELGFFGERLHYRLVSGAGPEEGWVSLTVKGRDLLARWEPPVELEEDLGGPAEGAGEVEVDEALRKNIETQAARLRADGALFRYCMKYKVLGYPLEAPQCRVLCFHNAGSAESNFTRTVPLTPFMAWVKEHSTAVEVCAVDFPGRNNLRSERKHESTDTLCPELLAVLYDKLADGVPYMVWAHSVGTWVAFELLILARKIGLPMPIAAFLNAFPAPHLPERARKWRRNRGLNEEQFKNELLNWDSGHFRGAGKVVFEEKEWKDTWQPLMRADFCLFDEYKYKHKGAPRFEFPIHHWHMSGDHYNTSEMVETWRDWTVGATDFQVLEMGHLACFYKPEFCKVMMQKTTDLMRRYAKLA